jgi:hypothetical protein
MKMTSKISVALNLILAAGLAVTLARRQNERAMPAPTVSKTQLLTPAESKPAPTSAASGLAKFRWQQLESKKSYRIYIANLRAIGCPEQTIEEIVRGDTERAFAWERSHLKLNVDKDGTGPWSSYREKQLVSSFLEETGSNEINETTGMAQSTQNQTQQTGNSEVAESQAQNADSTTPAYPLFLQDVNWSALGFNAEQQADIEQVRQQYLNDTKGLNQNQDESAGQDSVAPNQNAAPANSDSDTPTQAGQEETPLQSADDQLRGLLGTQGYNDYEMQQYYYWFQPQAVANVGGGNLNIDPLAFSLQ